MAPRPRQWLLLKVRTSVTKEDASFPFVFSVFFLAFPSLPGPLAESTGHRKTFRTAPHRTRCEEEEVCFEREKERRMAVYYARVRAPAAVLRHLRARSARFYYLRLLPQDCAAPATTVSYPSFSFPFSSFIPTIISCIFFFSSGACTCAGVCWRCPPVPALSLASPALLITLLNCLLRLGLAWCIRRRRVRTLEREREREVGDPAGTQEETAPPGVGEEGKRQLYNGACGEDP